MEISNQVEKHVFNLKQQEQNNENMKGKDELCKLTQLKNILRQIRKESPNHSSNSDEKKQFNRMIYYQPMNAYDEIIERCYLGDSTIALNRSKLARMGITHVLNAAQGDRSSQINTNEKFYQELKVKYLGCDLMDAEMCKIEHYFDRAADFIHDAVHQKHARILIHCLMGISRSATLLIAYLIKYKKMKLDDALRLVAQKRAVWPNDGFLIKLILYEKELEQEE